MRKTLLLAAVAMLAAGSFANRANAMTLGAPATLRAAIEESRLAQEVRWVCRHHYWSSRRTCWWAPDRYYYRPWRYRYYRWYRW